MVDMRVSSLEGPNLFDTLSVIYGFEVYDVYEGVLLDSVIGYTNDGTLIMILEEYATEWSSKYHIYAAKTDNDKSTILNLWEKFTKDEVEDNDKC